MLKNIYKRKSAKSEPKAFKCSPLSTWFWLSTHFVNITLTITIGFLKEHKALHFKKHKRLWKVQTRLCNYSLALNTLTREHPSYLQVNQNSFYLNTINSVKPKEGYPQINQPNLQIISTIIH